MSIEVVCPNGHKLKVKDKFSGKTGLCPRCKARVEVPSLLTDEFVLNVVGEHKQAAPQQKEWQPPEDDSASVLDEPKQFQGSGLSLLGSSIIQHKKVCPKCHETVGLQYASCPRCKTFFDDV